jgi:hypothetical protein
VRHLLTLVRLTLSDGAAISGATFLSSTTIGAGCRRQKPISLARSWVTILVSFHLKDREGNPTQWREMGFCRRQLAVIVVDD